MASLNTNEVVELLAGEGLTVTDSRLRYSVLIGEVPRPALSEIGVMRWGDEHIAAARTYFQFPRKRGRKTREQCSEERRHTEEKQHATQETAQ